MRRDDRAIPGPNALDTRVLALGEEWDVTGEFGPELFFGGDCTISVKLPPPFSSRSVQKFKIRGTNPSVNDILAYLRAANSPPYILPMAYVESGFKEVPAEMSRPKQFYTSNRYLGQRVDQGNPIWGAPDGWGILQADGTDGFPITSTVAWNWQKSIDAGLHKLTIVKVQEQEESFAKIKRQYPSLYIDPPTVNVDGVEYNPFDADLIIRYNGQKAFTFSPKTNPASRWLFHDNKEHYLQRVTQQFLLHGSL
jgi:hypothetical protein